MYKNNTYNTYNIPEGSPSFERPDYLCCLSGNNARSAQVKHQSAAIVGKGSATIRVRKFILL